MLCYVVIFRFLEANHERAAASNKAKFTPAELEQLCVECDTVDQFLDFLQRRAAVFSDPAIGAGLEVPGMTRQISWSKYSLS
jgi:hypothetical protein